MTRESTTKKGQAWFRNDDLRAVEKAIRRIVRANDLQSKALGKQIGLTAPQLVVLNGIAALGEVTTTVLSAHVDLSAATVITILDNLEARGLVERYRSLHDRRVVHTRLTPAGEELARRAPEPLGTGFAARLAQLAPERRGELIAALTAVADMMAIGPVATNQ
ncbi:MarR family winged helix-turn-helix transcriptional regulator [Nitratireductor soli]|uniref:MarR family winged helix-turn-helix transcriptional regulator n=1 Tax=Nitratireductor soli TaxID=1670619 RepID=UPI00065E34E6|nr:MarR family transcriptional regulator [Nitratireductor soli]